MQLNIYDNGTGIGCDLNFLVPVFVFYILNLLIMPSIKTLFQKILIIHYIDYEFHIGKINYSAKVWRFTK